MLKATPHRFGPWWVPVAAPHKTAARREPAHGLAERRWTVRRGWPVRAGTVQRLPCRDLHQHATRPLGYRPSPHGGIQHPPGQHAIACQAALQALAWAPLPGFTAAAAVQHPRPAVKAPATGVPRDALDGVCGGVHLTRAPQPPLTGGDVRWRRDFAPLDGPPRHRWPTCRRARLRRTQGQRTTPPRPRGFAGRLQATLGPLPEEGLHHRWRLNRGPHRGLGRIPTAVPRSAPHEVDTRETRGRQQVKELGFTVANADQARGRTPPPAHGQPPQDW
jgi:hypothetical protein